jgi:NADH-quinone oxidoreductase subunit E
MSNGISMERVDQIIDSYGSERHHLIAIMQDIQAEYKYLSPEVLERIAEKLHIGVAKVYSVATFYENFSLEAKGKYIIKVCDGTACHIKGAPLIEEWIRQAIGVAPGETDAEGRFSVESVACLGCCSLAPVMSINGRVYGKLDRRELNRILKEYKDK